MIDKKSSSFVKVDQKKKILLIEDDSHVCSFVNKGLSEENFEVSVAMDGTIGLQMALSSEFDLIILDIMLPSVGGLDVCKTIRSNNQEVPILLLSALGSTENVVMGLNTGADDYLTKPFKFIETIVYDYSELKLQTLRESKKEKHVVRKIILNPVKQEELYEQSI